MAQKILVIEDETDIRELIHFHLFKENYEVVLAGDGEEGLNKAIETNPDLILLDLMLPKLDGISVCGRLRGNESTQEIPVVMLTAKGSEEDIVRGLEVGADDYITKPFSPKVLLARVKAVLRRKRELIESGTDLLELHGIKMDLSKRKVYVQGVELQLTFTEFQILHLLMNKAGWVFSRSQIVDSVRGDNHAITDRSVDVQVVGIRRKLGQKGKLIETVRGVGYRFKDPTS